MGYYTHYSLDVKGITEDPKDIEELRDYLEERQLLYYAFEEPEQCGDLWEFDPYDECKWYDHDEDMKAVSKAFPDCTFRLTGFGETFDGCWQRYYKNGRTEICEAHFDEPKTISW